MTERKIILIIIASTLLILFGGVYVLSTTTTPPTTSKRVKALAVQTAFDWGTINMSNGNVEKTFAIKNTGNETLKLFNVKTSCHCTKARVKIGKEESPDFGMTGLSSWVGQVVSEQEAELTVIFDPAYHGPQGVGPINRFVSVETNDSSNPKLTFTVTGTVVK